MAGQRAEVVQPLGNRAETGLDVAQALAKGDLREDHRQELVPTGEAPNPVIAPIPLDQTAERVPRQMVEQLGEHGASLVHGQSWLKFKPGSHREGPSSSR
jgi:hypothetical protein